MMMMDEPVMHPERWFTPGDAPFLMQNSHSLLRSRLYFLFVFVLRPPFFYVILGLQIYYLYIHKNMYLYVYKICICASTSLCICMTTKTLFQNRSLVFTYPSWPPNYVSFDSHHIIPCYIFPCNLCHNICICICICIHNFLAIIF